MGFSARAAIPASSAYVQRGLAMHWDAIDNVGVGQHGADTTTWKDLTGNGFDWTLNPSWCTWGDSSISFAVTESGSESTIPGTTTKKYTDFEKKITTMEFVFKADEYLNAVIFSPGFANREAGAVMMKDYHYILFWDASATSQKMWGVPLDLDEHKYTVVYERASGDKRPSGLAAVYVDGRKTTPVQIDSYLGQVATPSLGGRDTTWSKTVKGHLRALRIYSIPLTEEEIALNHAIDRIRLDGAAPEDVLPAGYSVGADGSFVRGHGDNTVFDDAKVWYKGACGNAAGTADSGGADGWSATTVSKLRSVTMGGLEGGSRFDGGSYCWWGWRMRYENEHVKMPYAGLDLGETPCMIFPGNVTTTGWATVTIKDVEMERPTISYKVGAFRLNNLLADWPADKVCSNYTAVLRFKAGEPINPVPTGKNLMKLFSAGSVWAKGEAGLSLTLMSTDYLSDRYRMRWTVGDSFAYETGLEFDRDRWVDVAVVVDSPKLTIHMCCEDGPEGALTNRFSTFTKIFSAGNNPRPAIAANRRVFALGSSGSGSARYDTFTNGVSSASDLNGDFRGAFHQFAFWDRTLTDDEVREAMGRPALVKVGLTGNLANGEFRATKTAVDAVKDWEELDPVLTAANPSATIAFDCPIQYDGLPQVLRISACADSGAGSLAATVNGTALETVEVKPGAMTWVFIPKGTIATGANTLVLTRKSGEALKLDAVSVDGSWQNGYDEQTTGIGYFGYGSNLLDSYVLSPACGQDKFHVRGSGGAGNPYRYRFRVPEEMVGRVKGKLYFRVQNTSNTYYPFETSMNGIPLSTNQLRSGSTCTVRVPAAAFTTGWNEARFRPLSGWGNMDCHRFTLEPERAGMLLIVR